MVMESSFGAAGSERSGNTFPSSTSSNSSESRFESESESPTDSICWGFGVVRLLSVSTIIGSGVGSGVSEGLFRFLRFRDLSLEPILCAASRSNKE